MQRISGKLTGFWAANYVLELYSSEQDTIRTYGGNFKNSSSIADAITVEVELVQHCFHRFRVA
jgi:hypothetical protein